MYKFNIGDIVTNCNTEYTITDRHMTYGECLYSVKTIGGNRYHNNPESIFKLLRPIKKNNYELK